MNILQRMRPHGGNGGLIDRLPMVRGRYMADAELSRVTWFRVGGPADVVFRPLDLADLQEFLAHTPGDIPLHVIGVGSNLLVRDGGVRGVVIRLGGPFAQIDVGDDGVVHAGAAAMDANLARSAANHGRGGLEFFSGIPGSVGGALRMNAGAYDTETRDHLIRVSAVDRAGELHRLDAAAMGMGYRRCGVPDDRIFIAARFRTVARERAEIFRRMDEIRQARIDSQPIRSRTGGSTFRNPPGARAWELIAKSGCRGLTRGDAMVSEQHCNFLINRGQASAADLETLGEEVRRRVAAETGITLEWEIRRIGEGAS